MIINSLSSPGHPGLYRVILSVKNDSGTASCSVPGPPLAIGMKPQALHLRHRPVSAFIGLNKLAQDISSIAADFKGSYMSGFNSLVEKASVTEYVSFLTVFVGAVGLQQQYLIPSF